MLLDFRKIFCHQIKISRPAKLMITYMVELTDEVLYCSTAMIERISPK